MKKSMPEAIHDHNVNYHPMCKIYSSSLGAIHLAFHESREEAKVLVKQATDLYKQGMDYKHLRVPMNNEIWHRLGYT